MYSLKSRDKTPLHFNFLVLFIARLSNHQLSCLSDRYNFPLMVFCSGCNFLTIAAIFFTVSSLDSPVLLLLNFCSRSLLVMGFRVRYLLTASSVIPWGPSSLLVGVGVLVLEPPPVPTEEGVGDTRGFLDAGLPSSPVFPFLAELAGRFLVLAYKNIRNEIQIIICKRRFSWGIRGRIYSQVVAVKWSMQVFAGRQGW